jgi:hypothetical protein
MERQRSLQLGTHPAGPCGIIRPENKNRIDKRQGAVDLARNRIARLDLPGVEEHVDAYESQLHREVPASSRSFLLYEMKTCIGD